MLVGIFVGPSRDPDRNIRHKAIWTPLAMPEMIEALRYAAAQENVDYSTRYTAQLTLEEIGYKPTGDDEEIFRRNKVEWNSNKFKRGDLVEYTGSDTTLAHLKGYQGTVMTYVVERDRYLVSYIRLGGPKEIDPSDLRIWVNVDIEGFRLPH